MSLLRYYQIRSFFPSLPFTESEQQHGAQEPRATGSQPDGWLVRYMRNYVEITFCFMGLSIPACILLLFIPISKSYMLLAIPLFIIMSIGYNPVVFAYFMASWLVDESIAGEQAWKNVFLVAVTPPLIGLFAFGVRELWLGRRQSGAISILLVWASSTIAEIMVLATNVTTA